MLVALGEEVVVELHALGVDLAGAVGEDAAPGDGETDAVDAELFAQLQIDGILVVEVGSGIGGEAALGLQEVVPGNLALTVSAGLALYLVGSGGAAKDKVLGKLRRRVGDASGGNGHDEVSNHLNNENDAEPVKVSERRPGESDCPETRRR